MPFLNTATPANRPQVIDADIAAQGSILVADGSDVTHWMAPGTPGYVLQTNGAGALPTWVPAGGGGGSADISITDNVANAFRVHEGANDYFNVDTTNNSEQVLIGNTGTDPTISIFGRTLGFAQEVRTSGSPNAFAVIGAAHTTLAASTEASDIRFQLARTVQFATGALTTQRAVRIQTPTYAFVGASTITDAATVAISGAPAAGTNATITNAHALWIEAGQSTFGGTIRQTAGAIDLDPSASVTLDIAGGQTLTITVGDNTVSALLIRASDGANLFGATTSNGTETISIGNLNTGLIITQTGISRFTTAVLSSGNPNILRTTGAAHTGFTASTEILDLDFNLSRTLQWSTGAITTQRSARFQAPTISFVGSSTVTTAATVAIAGAPVAGTNATITNAYALLVEGGQTGLTGNLNFLAASPIITSTVSGSTLLIRGNIGASSSSDDIQVQSQATRTNGRLFNVYNNGTRVASFRYHGGLAIDQVAEAGNFSGLFVATAGAHTTLTASTEFTDVDINLARSVQFNTGALATQRAMRVRAPTFTFVGASTITDCATVALTGAPIAGTNATITRSMALWTEAGRVSFDQTSDASGGLNRFDLFRTRATGVGFMFEERVFDVTLAGSSTDISVAFPAGCLMLGGTLQVTTTITGATSFDLGVAGDTGRYGTAYSALAAGAPFSMLVNIVSGVAGVFCPSHYLTNTNLRFTANGSNFTGGVVHVRLLVLRSRQDWTD